MRVYLNCTANLGDFLNAIPVLSGLKNSYGKYELIVKKETKKFSGFRELLEYQDFFSAVNYDDEILLYGDQPIILSSWTREDKTSEHRPIETCRYENWLKDHYNLEYEVDDNVKLKFPYMKTIESYEKFVLGDRWTKELDPNVDTRRKTSVLKDSGKFNNSYVTYLSYYNSLFYNMNVIQNSKKPFITTFTGIGILADLMGKETIVLYDDDMKMWDGRPVEYDFERHYYGDRKSKLEYIREFNLGDLND